MKEKDEALFNTQPNAEKTSSEKLSSELIKNIRIPNSQFEGKYIKDKGYCIGIENVQISKFKETLEEALNEIGYGVDVDKDGDEILVKVGDVNYEIIANITRALIHVSLTNNVNNG